MIHDLPLDSPELASAQQIFDACGVSLRLVAELALPHARAWWAARAPGSAPEALLLAWHAADEWQVVELATLPDARRAGLARRLLAGLVEHARQAGDRALSLEVRVSNTPARALYEQTGFIETRRRPRYYDAPAEDGIEMLLELRAQTPT